MIRIQWPLKFERAKKPDRASLQAEGNRLEFMRNVLSSLVVMNRGEIDISQFMLLEGEKRKLIFERKPDGSLAIRLRP